MFLLKLVFQLEMVASIVALKVKQKISSFDSCENQRNTTQQTSDSDLLVCRLRV